MEPEGFSELPLFGRDHDVESIGGLVDGGTLLTLVGPAGIGKTRLVHAVVDRVSSRFGESRFVPLAERDESVESRIAAALGAADPEAVLFALAGDESLLVLDNVEHVREEVAAWVTATREALPSLAILATSREALGVDDEVVFHVDPLPEVAAAELYVHRASLRGAAPALEDVKRAIGVLGGVPLAVELAAGRVRSLPPSALESRLRTAGVRLLSTRDRMVPDRHRAVESALDSSWELLDPPERFCFAGLAAFRGPFRLEDVEGVLGVDGWSRATLESLVAKSLIRRPTKELYELLEPIRLYALERLRERGDGATLFSRHAEYFANVGSNGRVGRCPTLLYANLAAAIERVSDDGSLLARLVRAGEYSLRLRRAMEELRRISSVALAKLDADDDRSRALLSRSWAGAAGALGRLEDARRAIEQAWEIAGRLDDDEVTAEVGSLFCNIYIELGRWKEAEAVTAAALAASRRHGAYDLLVDALHRNALVVLQSGDIDRATRLCREAVGVAIRNGDELEAGRASVSLATILVRAARPEEAAEALRRAAESTWKHGDRYWSVVAVAHEGALFLREGKLDAAEERFERARELGAEVGARSFVSDALLGLGTVALLRDEDPREHLHAALDVLIGMNVYYEMARAYSLLGVWELRNGHAAMASDLFRRALGRISMVPEPQWQALLMAYRACGSALLGDREAMSRGISEARRGWTETEFEEDLAAVSEVCEALYESKVPVMSSEWDERARSVQRSSSIPWLPDNHIRSLFSFRPPGAPRSGPKLVVRREARELTLPDGELLDFTRRGPLRRMVLALATAAAQSPGECLRPEDLIDAAYPDEVMTEDSGKMRIYTSIRRLRKMGLGEYLMTRDDGYLFDPSLAVELEE